MRVKELPPLRVRKKIDIAGMTAIADRAYQTLVSLRDSVLEPWPRKQAPIMTSSRLAQLCEIDRVRLNYLCTKGYKGNYPVGSLRGEGRSREFTTAEAQEFVRAHGPYRARPEGRRAVVISVGNFKGGVGKTTQTVALAQGLAMRGYKVLLGDLDPQGSTTTMMGYVPEAEVTEDMTVMPFIYGEIEADDGNGNVKTVPVTDLWYAVRESYWPGLDLIPSCPALFGADFFLPNKQAKDPDFEFWKVLDDGLQPLKDVYDVILLDTPPTLSYLATGAFMASDGMIVPLPPETLDYASSTQFFRQFAELFVSLTENRDGLSKEFDFIKIVLSRVKEVKTTENVREWIQDTYPELLGSSEIFETDVVKNAASWFKTVYDLSTLKVRDKDQQAERGGYEGSPKALSRALEYFDDFVDEIIQEIHLSWGIPVQTKKDKK